MVAQEKRATNGASGHQHYSQSPSQDGEEPLATSACENCRTRKVRCDRQIPQCSNCLKAGVPCEFPNRGKRTNHVKQLYVVSAAHRLIVEANHNQPNPIHTHSVEDVSGLASRLDSIDKAIQTLVENVSTLQSTSSLLAANPSSRSSTVVMPEFPPSSDIEELESIFYASYVDANSSAGITRSAGNTGDAQRSTRPLPGSARDGSLGHIGARSLFENSRRILAYLLDRFQLSDLHNADQNRTGEDCNGSLFTSPQASALKSALWAKYNQYPFIDSQNPHSATSDGQPVAPPPRSLLETSLPVFIEYFNTTTPVFNESRLKEAINPFYSNLSAADEAYNLLFNNIIVLALGLRSRVSHMDQSSPKDMSDELFPAFLNNSFRAFQRLSGFLQPRLVCCQALATLVSTQSLGCILLASSSLHLVSSGHGDSRIPPESGIRHYLPCHFPGCEIYWTATVGVNRE